MSKESQPTEKQNEAWERDDLGAKWNNCVNVPIFFGGIGIFSFFWATDLLMESVNPGEPVPTQSELTIMCLSMLSGLALGTVTGIARADRKYGKKNWRKGT